MKKSPQQFNIYDAKSQLSDLVERASQGESFIIAKAGEPKALLCPLEPKKKAGFPFGIMEGQITISDDFDAPLPPEIIALFEEGPIEPIEPIKSTESDVIEKSQSAKKSKGRKKS